MTADAQPSAKRRRGRPRSLGGPMSAAEKSARAEAKRAAERQGILDTWADSLRAATLRRTDTAGHRVISAIGDALIGMSLDLHTGPGDGAAGADAAIRAAVRSLHTALTSHLGGDPEAGDGAILQALDEIRNEREEHL